MIVHPARTDQQIGCPVEFGHSRIAIHGSGINDWIRQLHFRLARAETEQLETIRGDPAGKYFQSCRQQVRPFQRIIRPLRSEKQRQPVLIQG